MSELYTSKSRFGTPRFTQARLGLSARPTGPRALVVSSASASTEMALGSREGGPGRPHFRLEDPGHAAPGARLLMVW